MTIRKSLKTAILAFLLGTLTVSLGSAAPATASPPHQPGPWTQLESPDNPAPPPPDPQRLERERREKERQEREKQEQERQAQERRERQERAKRHLPPPPEESGFENNK